MISLLPGKILRLLEFVGFSGNKVSKLSLVYFSEIPILRPPFGLPKSGLISEVVLILNTIS